jgi:hypothetical protein
LAVATVLVTIAGSASVAGRALDGGRAPGRFLFVSDEASLVARPPSLSTKKELIGPQVKVTPMEVLERLHRAMNQHDLEAFVACFDPDYTSEQPVHPNRGFGGREQVEKNWTAVFEGIPDFHAELLATAIVGDTLWSEWHWTGTRANEAPLDIRGVTLFGIQNGRIVSGRLYMEETEEAGGDIDETVRRLAEGTRLEGE